MCVCRISVEKTSDALEYANAHLNEGRSFIDGWAVEYTCPTTGQRWLMDRPWSSAHGGGPPRLRTAAAVAREVRTGLALADFLLDDEESRRATSALCDAIERRYGPVPRT